MRPLLAFLVARGILKSHPKLELAHPARGEVYAKKENMWSVASGRAGCELGLCGTSGDYIIGKVDICASS